MTENKDDCFPMLLGICMAALVVLTVVTIHVLPREIAAIAVSWILLSLSAGISFGHFVLNEP